MKRSALSRFMSVHPMSAREITREVGKGVAAAIIIGCAVYVIAYCFALVACTLSTTCVLP